MRVGFQDSARSHVVYPDVSVIIPHYSDLAGLDRCLEAVMNQVGVTSFEVIVADNESPEGVEAVEKLIAGRARLVISAERGAGPTRNAAVSAALGRVLAFTDADCVPEPDWLDRGTNALGRFDVVGGQVSVLRSEAKHISGSEAFERVFAFDNRSYIESKGFSVTANLFCSREVFETVGLFRNGVPEDMDWCLRAKDHGYTIGYASDAVVGHPPRRTWRELIHKWRRLQRESYVLASSSKAGRAKWLMKSWLLPVSVILHTHKVVMHPSLDNKRERLGAFWTLVALRMWRLVDAHKIFVMHK